MPPSPETPGAAGGNDTMELLDQLTEQIRTVSINRSSGRYKRNQQSATPQSGARWEPPTAGCVSMLFADPCLFCPRRTEARVVKHRNVYCRPRTQRRTGDGTPDAAQQRFTPSRLALQTCPAPRDAYVMRAPHSAICHNIRMKQFRCLSAPQAGVHRPAQGGAELRHLPRHCCPAHHHALR